MKIFNYLKLLKENKRLKENELRLYRLVDDLTEQASDYKSRNNKHLKTIKELKERLKEVKE